MIYGEVRVDSVSGSIRLSLRGFGRAQSDGTARLQGWQLDYVPAMELVSVYIAHVAVTRMVLLLTHMKI